jgi:hypothetical protein
MSISLTDGRTFSQLVSFAGAVFLINVVECSLDVLELVLLCANCYCQCYSGGMTTIHPEQEMNQEAMSERRKAADVETESKVLGRTLRVPPYHESWGQRFDTPLTKIPTLSEGFKKKKRKKKRHETAIAIS